MSSRSKQAISTRSIDDILMALNWWGRYQKVQFVLLMLSVLAVVMHSMSVVFIGNFSFIPCIEKMYLYPSIIVGRDAEHRCAEPPGRSMFYGNANPNSNNITDISGYNDSTSVLYNIDTPSSMNGTTTKYGKCKVRTYDSSGRQISSVQCPYGYQYSEPRDRTYGRKTVHILCHTFLFLLAVTTAFSPNFIVFTVVRFFTGAAQQGTALTASVLNIEQLPTAHRALVSQVGIFMHPTSLLSLGLVAYLTREINWRYAQLAMSAFSVYVLVQWWITDESLRWLVANGRTKEAERNIRKAARQNKTDVRKAMKLFNQDTQPIFLNWTKKVDMDQQVDNKDKNEHSDSEPMTGSQKSQKPDQEEDHVGFLKAIRNPTVLKVQIICCLIWFADSASYYGLIMTSTTLVDDLYLGYTVNILVELPAALAYVLLINRFADSASYYGLIMTSTTLVDDLYLGYTVNILVELPAALAYVLLINRIGRLRCIYIFNSIGGISLLTAVGLSTFTAAGEVDTEI
ncbi:organic cation transporter protein [Elysia marginata]|uniref:Organic cation transporter protein n=1 Tax=Elysia marginata TaxID=1093978 RepID=A0AAV4GS58_9GAST|nr:organic cation transporter protein [Elysia marginata]